MNATITPPKLVKSKKGWYVYYSIYENGKRKKYSYTDNMNREKNLKERQKIANNLIRDITTLHQVKKTDVPKSLKPLSLLLDEMLELKKPSVRSRTYETYKYGVRVFKRFLEGTNQLNATDFKGLSFADWLVKEGYSGRGFNNLIILNRILFNMLEERELILKNPLKKVPQHPESQNSHRAFSKEQKEQLKEYMLKHDPLLWNFVKFIYHPWIRPAEILQLKVSDIDLERRTIMIWGGVAKNRMQIPVDIPDSFIDEVKGMKLHRYPAESYLFGYQFMICPKPYSRNRVSKRHSEILKKLGYQKGFTMYSWKATGMCDAYDAGVDVYAIMRQARHHSLDQTITYLKSMGRIPNVSFKSLAPCL